MNKIGSIKRLTKELSKKYAQDEEATKTLDEVVSFFPGFKFMFSLVFFCTSVSHLPRHATELNKHLKVLDNHYNKCNEAWARGEADRFVGDVLLGWLPIILARACLGSTSRLSHA